MPRSLRVLMVCPQFRPMVGGYERAAERLSQRLAARGNQVTVVAEKRDPSWLRIEHVGGITIRRVWVARSKGLQTATGILSLLRFLLAERRNFDVVHVHQYGWSAAVALTIARLCSKPSVLKLTGTGDDGIGPSLRRARFSTLLARIHRGVDACLASSQRAIGEAQAFGIAPDRIHWISNGIDTHRIRPLVQEERRALRARFGLDDSLVTLFVGRLGPVKNALGLIDAWRKLGPPEGAMLVFVGDGPDRKELDARAQKTGASVRLMGFVSDPLEWYQAADLFVLPSIREGLSNSLLEALACALPVVSTPVSGSEDIFAAADVGVLVAGPDPDSLADGLHSLLSDPDRRARCGAEARRLAVERFSLDRVAGEVESLYWTLTRREPTVTARIQG